MQKDEIYNYCVNQLGITDVKLDEPMCNHTSFKIGGNADVFVKANSIDTLKELIDFAKTNGVSYTIIGNGSNLLVKDNGIRGIVIKLDFKNVTIEKINDKMDMTNDWGSLRNILQNYIRNIFAILLNRNINTIDRLKIELLKR